jgi:alpha-methylacyl-CoA racemase
VSGPLSGLTVIELAGLGPGPFCAMVLADLGARVIRIDRPAGPEPLVAPELALTNRGKVSIVLDLKQPRGRQVALRLIRSADVLIEGYRPGVTERMGLGPDDCLRVNAALVYGRMTGWGQEGELAQRPGHDINYTALSGALFGIGPAERPLPALNLLGDFGGGGMLLAFGVLAAVISARRTGRGQVVDAAMVDGVSLLATGLHGLAAAGSWHDQRQVNMFDGSRPYYTTYQTSDGGHLAVGALEPKFWRVFLTAVGLADTIDAGHQDDPATWERTRRAVAGRIAERTLAEWTTLLASVDACATPVLPLTQAPGHPHHRSRDSFVEIAGVTQPRPAPRFAATPTSVPSPPPRPGADTAGVLREAGYDERAIAELIASGVAHADPLCGRSSKSILFFRANAGDIAAARPAAALPGRRQSCAC